MMRRVFPVALPHATDDACTHALLACATPDTLFVETDGSMPRLGEDLTVTCRRVGGPELLRIDGHATWAIHESIGRFRRGFGLTIVDADKAVLSALRERARENERETDLAPDGHLVVVRPGTNLATPVIDDDALTAWRARCAERASVSPATASSSSLDERARDDAQAERRSTHPVIDESSAAIATSHEASAKDDVAHDEPTNVDQEHDDTTPLAMPAIAVDAFAIAEHEAARDVVQDATIATIPVVNATTEGPIADGTSAPRRPAWLSNPDGDPLLLPRLVDDEDEDATLLVGPRLRPLPSVPDGGERLPFPSLKGAAWVVATGRPKESPSSMEKLSWPRHGTKRGMSPFPDNDDTIPVGLWTMPSLVHPSVTSDEETPDDRSDPRLIVRAADRARALDALSDVPDLPVVRPNGAIHAPLPPSLHNLLDDVDDESTDAALSESTADASAETSGESATSTAPPAGLEGTPRQVRVAEHAPSLDAPVVDARDPSAHAVSVEADRANTASTQETPTANGASMPAAKASGNGNGHALKTGDESLAAARNAILVAWGAETPHLLFAHDTPLPTHTVLEVPRRHLRFAEIALFEGTPAREQPKGLLGIVRLTVAPETSGRTLLVRFSLTTDGVVTVSYDGRVVERLSTSFAPRVRPLVLEEAEPSSTFVGKLKRLLQGR